MSPGSSVKLSRRSAAKAFVAWLASGCAHAPTAAGPAPKPAPPLHEGPLTDYVPAAGLRWMVVGEPRKLAETPAFQDSLTLLLPAARLDAFASGSGIELKRVESGVIAGFDLGTLYLFTPPSGTAARIVDRFRERLVGGERIDTPHPDIQRVSGVVGEHPQSLVRVDDRLIAIAVGDPTLSRVVEAFVRKKLHHSPPALRGAALSQLTSRPPHTAASFYAPGPFTGEWAQGAHGLLADAVALSISLVGVAPQSATATLELAGDFPPSGRDALVRGFMDLAQSSTGKLFGLDQIAAPRVREREGHLLLDVDLALSPIARGLRAAVIADVWEILDLPRTLPAEDRQN